jgi:hypothetical protein
MHISSIHTQKFSSRRLKATVLTVLYLLMVAITFAPINLHSANIAHAGTSECTGDCKLCGCSPESRASNTCCCSKKRLQQLHAQEDHEAGTLDCCKKKPVEKTTIIACGCPCGSGEQSVMSITGALEVLPYHFTESFIVPSTITSYFSHTNRLTSRHGEPPDPPPRQS